MNDVTPDKFLHNVRVCGPDECWEWQRGRNGKASNQQYGVLWVGKKKWKTHRLAFELFVRHLEPGEWVLHHCDNPPCCNPAHLYAGNVQQNNADMYARGRAKREMGSKRYNAKLTEEQVERIKREAPFRKYGWGRALAREFGVSTSAVANIVCGLRWKQVAPKNM